MSNYSIVENRFTRVKLFPVLFIFSALLCYSNAGKAQGKEEERIEKATQLLRDFGSMKESIPQELLRISNGIVIVPKMINAGFVIGGKRGRGIAMVKNDDGTWSDPLFITITGGSIGFQIGVQAVDLVLIFKHRETLEDMGSGTFTLGGDVSATAGPVGRSGSATTDYKFEAEVYSYSRSKGLFAGISLAGSAINIDVNANESFYGGDVSTDDILQNEKSDDARIIALQNELEGMVRKAE